MKNKLNLIIMLSTLSILAAITSLTTTVYAQEEITTGSENTNKTFALDSLIYESMGNITGRTVLNAEEGKVESSEISEGTLNGINVTELGTFLTIPLGNNTFYGEGQGIVTTKLGGETASFRGYGIGDLDESGLMTIRGVNFYKTSNQELSFVNNMVGLFEYEVDQDGNTHKKIWDWK